MIRTERRQLGQAGFSLLEIILALSIFSISAVILIRGFYTAASVNRNSEKMQEASVLAQNLMEEMKAKSIEELTAQFGAPEANSKTEEGIYSFLIKKYESGKHHFDVRIWMDASSYHDDGETGINDQKLPDISNLNVYEDAFLVQNKKMDQKVLAHYEQLYRNAGSGSLSEEEFQKSLKRTLTIEVGSGKANRKVQAEYVYQYDEPEKIGCAAGAHREQEESCSCFYRDFYTIYDNSESEEDVRAIYLFYHPLYQSGSGGEIRDFIVFRNLSNCKMDFYVIKQMPEDETGLAEKEYGYKMSLKIQEKPERDAWLSGKGSTVLKTNLNENLAARELSGERRTENQMTLVYEDLSQSPSGIKEGQAARTMAGMSLITAEESGNRIFEVKVEIYEAGADRDEGDKPLVTLEGSKLE